MNKATVTVEMAKALVEFLAQNMDIEAFVHEGYSGRGMYGETCVGLSTDASPVAIGIAIGQLTYEDEEWENLILNQGALPFQRQDSMGLETIYY